MLNWRTLKGDAEAVEFFTRLWEANRTSRSVSQSPGANSILRSAPFRELPLSTQLSGSQRASRTAGVGHQNAFLRPRLDARYRFSKGTLAGTRSNGGMRRFRTFPPSPRNGEVRPEAAVRRL